MPQQDLYEVLNVSRDADEGEIKRSYRRLARKYHPDINKDPESEEKFKEINEAYQVLGDSQKRATYDQFGHVDGAQGHNGGQDFNPFDIFEQFFKQQNGNFSSGFHSHHGPETTTKEDLPPLHLVNITFLDAIKGVAFPVSFKANLVCSGCRGNRAFEGDSRYITYCSNCEGSGVELIQARTFFGVVNSKRRCNSCGGEGKTIIKPCSGCRGKGYVAGSKEVKLDITPRIKDGEKLVLKDKDVIGGKVYFQVEVISSEFFTREGDDIYTKMLVNPITALLGGECELPTPWGVKLIQIQPNTKDGEHLKLKGMGIKELRSDLIGVVHYTDLPNLSSEDRELLSRIKLSEVKEQVDWIKKIQKVVGNNEES